MSSDRRIRRAAQRRRARSLSADEFLDLLERFQTAKRHEMASRNLATSRSLERESQLSAEEAALWLAEFGELGAAVVDDRHIHGAEHAVRDRARARNVQEMASLVLGHGVLLGLASQPAIHIAFNFIDFNL